MAVEGIETATDQQIVLFNTEPVTLAEANARVRAAGHHAVMRLDEVRRIPAISILSTPKTDYKVPRAQIEKKQKAKAGAV